MTANRHSFKSVSRFFPAMQAVMDAQHNPNLSTIEISPRSLGLSPATAAARLRDAIQAVRNQLLVPPFDWDIFEDAIQGWIVTSNDTKVHLIHRKRLEEQSKALSASTLEVEVKGPVTVEKELTYDLAHCLGTLLGARVLEGEFRVRLQLTEAELGWLSNLDITIIDNNDGTHTLI